MTWLKEVVAVVRDSEEDRATVIAAVRQLPPADLAHVAALVREEPSAQTRAQDSRLERLVGPLPASGRRLSNEIEATLRAFEKRRALLGDSLTAAQVAGALGVSRETVYSRAERGDLLAAVDGGQLRFPHWQFDPLSDDGLLAGLRSVLTALATRSALAKITWLISPRASLEGAPPLELLRAGHSDQVLPAAQRFALGE